MDASFETTKVSIASERLIRLGEMSLDALLVQGPKLPARLLVGVVRKRF